MRLSFDLAVDEENDDTKEWREDFSRRLQNVLVQVILTRLVCDHSSNRDPSSLVEFKQYFSPYLRFLSEFPPALQALT